MRRSSRCSSESRQKVGNRHRGILLQGGLHARRWGSGARAGNAPSRKRRRLGGAVGAGEAQVILPGADVIILDKTTQKILDIIREVAILHRDIAR